MRGLIAKKLGMTQVFDDGGLVVPVTIIEAGPCMVTQIKTVEIDGYDAVQVGYGEKKDKHTTTPMKGHYKKASLSPKDVLAEFDTIPGYDYKMGQVFDASLFSEGDIVNVTGTSKGRGFSGVIKRHVFSKGPVTHGQREYLRAPGSIGQASDPSRVFKGMRMAGQYGNKKKTIENLSVVKVDLDNNQLFLKGSVPGANNGIVIIKK